MRTEDGTGDPGARGQHSIAALDLLVDVLTHVDVDRVAEDFYSRLAEAVCRFAGMRRAVIFRYDDAVRRVRAAGAHGLDLHAFAGSPVTLESAPAARDALVEDRVIEVRQAAGHGISGPLAGLVGSEPLVYAPIAAGGRWIGVIVAELEAGSPPLDAARRDLLWTLGKTLALASTARIATFHGARARQLEERIALTREIHDRVVQRLFGVSLVLSANHALDGETRARCADEVQEALRDLASALRRPVGSGGSRPTETTLARELERLHSESSEPELRVEGPVPPVPAELERLAQSVLAEAMRNARKHARPEHLTVRVRRSDDTFILEVENDGVVSRGDGSTGMGLRLAALEALQAGGLVEFGRPTPQTWQIRLVMPLPEDEGG